MANSSSPLNARRLLLTLLATIGGSAYLVVGTIVWSIVALLLSWLPPRGLLVYKVARLWARGLLLSSGVRLRCERQLSLDSDSHFVFMANHQSLIDIPALLTTLPGETRFLAKSSLFKIPLFGWVIKAAGFVTIDRKDLSQAPDAFATAVQRLQASSVLVFPEGTRSLDGLLLPFQRGGFLVALKTGMAIVPVGIAGSLQVRSRNSYLFRPGTVVVTYGSPVETGDLGVSGKEELMATVRRRISELARPKSTS